METEEHQLGKFESNRRKNDKKNGEKLSPQKSFLLYLHDLIYLLAIVVILFLLFRRVSVCSMAAALSYPGLYYLFNPSPDLRFWLCCFIGLLVFFLHRGNLMRLLRGQEPKFRPGSKP